MGEAKRNLVLGLAKAVNTSYTAMKMQALANESLLEVCQSCSHQTVADRPCMHSVVVSLIKPSIDFVAKSLAWKSNCLCLRLEIRSLKQSTKSLALLNRHSTHQPIRIVDDDDVVAMVAAFDTSSKQIPTGFVEAMSIATKRWPERANTSCLGRTCMDNLSRNHFLHYFLIETVMDVAGVEMAAALEEGQQWAQKYLLIRNP